MKKYLSLLLALILLLSMSACSPKKEEPKAEAPKAEAPKVEEPKKEVTVRDFMKNTNVRKAISCAFDKEFIQDEILANGSVAANYMVPTGLAKNAEGKDFRDKYPEGFLQYDVKKAQEYWAAAKKELGFETMKIELLSYDNDVSKKLTEFLQAQLQTNLPGLTVELKQQPFKQKLELSKNGQFQLELAGWGADYPDPMTFMDLWVSGGGHNSAGYNFPDYDKVISDSKSGALAAKPVERWEALQEFEKKILADDPVVSPIYQRGRAVLQKPTYKGVVRHMFGPDASYDQATTEVLTNGKKIIRLSNASDIPSMDPNKATDTVAFEVMGGCYEGLLSLDKGDVVRPGVAEKYEVSADGLTYTFYLRKNAVWSNGDKVVAQNFVDSFRRLADPNTKSQYMFMVETAQIKNYKNIAEGKDKPETLGVEAKDDYTLVVTLENPVPFFDKLMTFGSFSPINKAFVDKVGDAFGTAPDKALYNGPYVLTKWEVGYGYEMMRNTKYWNDKETKNDGVTWRIVKDSAADVNLYETGQIDFVRLSGPEVKKYMDHPEFLKYNEAVVFWLVFNMGNDGMK